PRPAAARRSPGPCLARSAGAPAPGPAGGRLRTRCTPMVAPAVLAGRRRRGRRPGGGSDPAPAAGAGPAGQRHHGLRRGRLRGSWLSAAGRPRLLPVAGFVRRHRPGPGVPTMSLCPTLCLFALLFPGLAAAEARPAQPAPAAAARQAELPRWEQLSAEQRELLVAPLRDRWNAQPEERARIDRKSTRLNSSHVKISYAVFCLKKKNTNR